MKKIPAVILKGIISGRKRIERNLYSMNCDMRDARKVEAFAKADQPYPAARLIFESDPGEQYSVKVYKWADKIYWGD